MDFEDFLGQFMKCFSNLFEDTGNLEKCNLSKAKPLFLSIRWESFSSCFHAFSKTSSRAGILSIFYRILVIWGLHFETFASTFGSHFFRSQKSQNVFFGPAPGSRPSWTPPGEGGNRRPGSDLGGIWSKNNQMWSKTYQMWSKTIELLRKLKNLLKKQLNYIGT